MKTFKTLTQFLFLVLVLSSTICTAKPKLFIKVDPNLCVNCYATLAQLRSFSDNFNISFNIPDYSAKEIKSFVRNIVKLEKFEVIHDKLLKGSHKELSINQYLISDSAGLELLRSDIDNFHIIRDLFINPKLEEIKFKIHFKDSLDLDISRRTKLISLKNSLFLIDNFYGKLFQFTDGKITEIKISDFTERVYQEIYGDLDVYNQIKKLKSDVPMIVDMEIGAVQTKNDTLVFLVQISNLKQSETKKATVSLSPKNIILNFHKNKILSIKNIVNLPERRYIADGSFLVKGNKFTFLLPINDTDRTGDNFKYLGEFIEGEKSLTFSKTLDPKFPEEHFSKNAINKHSDSFENPSLFKTALAPFIIIPNDSSYLIRKYADYSQNGIDSYSTSSSNYMTMGSYIEENKITQFCWYKDNYYLDQFELKDKKLRLTSSINLSELYPSLKEKINFHEVKFISQNHALAYSNGQIIDIIFPEKLTQ